MGGYITLKPVELGTPRQKLWLCGFVFFGAVTFIASFGYHKNKMPI
jgi:hypothetical protein